MSTSRSRHLNAGRRVPPVVAKHSDGVGTLFGQPIAEPLRHLVGQPARLNEYHLRRLSASKKAKSFGKGRILFKEGELPNGVYVVLSGRVKKSIASSQGKNMVLGFFGPGSVLGLDANILGRVHATTAEAVQPTEAVAVPHRDLLSEIQSNATAAWQVAQLVSENCYFLRDKLASFQLAESAPQKLARCLLLLIPAGSVGSHGELVHLNLSQEVIAQMVGVTRETVSRQLARFRKNGVLTWNRSDLAICDRRALETLADLPEAVA